MVLAIGDTCADSCGGSSRSFLITWKASALPAPSALIWGALAYWDQPRHFLTVWGT
jgi:hypothetical protein